MDLLNFLLHSQVAIAAILKLLPVTLSLLVQLYFSCFGVPWSSLLMLVLLLVDEEERRHYEWDLDQLFYSHNFSRVIILEAFSPLCFVIVLYATLINKSKKVELVNALLYYTFKSINSRLQVNDQNTM
ncbi:hypothetical protein AHAS_Ahas03G0120800 [Arachis hypogaea]